jgi:transposase InsO family protein
MTEITAERCADSFVEGWISRFGMPDVVTTDRGTQFTSSTWACLASKVGFQHVLTSAYHLQANRMVERLHRQIKDTLRARGCSTAWVENLPWVMHGLRAAPKDESGISSARMVYGSELVLPGQPAWAGGHVADPQPPAGEEAMQQQIPLRPRSYAEAAKGPLESLEWAKYVYVRRGGQGGPTQQLYEGPFRVAERRPKTFLVKIVDRMESISIDRLKPHLGKEPATVALPPRRGRPPETSGSNNSPPDSSGGGQL